MAKKKTNGNGKVMKGEFEFEKDTKRTHRFKVGDYGEDISGTLYIPKGSKIPDKITLVRVAD